MYNHLITCSYDQNKYEAICESALTEEETILFWPDEFGFPSEEKEAATNALIEWAQSQDFKFVIYQGKR